MKIDVLTLFPEMFDALNVGILDRAQQKGLFEVKLTNIRDYSLDKHKKVDDTPFGGGAGMVMTPQPLHDAINGVDPDHKCIRVYLSPKGETLNQNLVKELSKSENIMLVCGAYEGIDQRVIDLDIDKEISIGDYVLTGGELAAMVVINSVSRYIDGVLGNSESTSEESFSDGLLEYPQYTHPQVFEGMEVPQVLLSGNHKNIAKWRHDEQIKITKERRPDLLK